LNPESPSTHKKSSIFEKLKDRTKKAGSKIKSKVGKKKNPDDTETPVVDGDEHEEETASDVGLANLHRSVNFLELNSFWRSM
jgi:hypothetical protein